METEDVLTSSDQVITLYERLVASFMSPCDVSERYDVKEKLGEGAFGVVSKVEHLETGNLAAMKTINVEKQGNDKKDVIREISAIIKLRSNENIVRLLDIFMCKENKLHFVMELCNEDLAKYMVNDLELTDRLRLNVAQQIAKGISVLHNNKPPIIHRDIKPENILIVNGERPEDIVVKIADFGISSIDVVKVDSTGTSSIPIIQTDMAQGTPPYMPPECYAALGGHVMVDEKFTFDASIDIFALGIVYMYIFCYRSNRYGKFISLYLTVLPHK